ncbi:MAG TPA: tetratricopeptide repeat protein [Kiloniellales bacterium]|nr:tetratricopeptide repeat protein [Kiloniellales bacterium]
MTRRVLATILAAVVTLGLASAAMAAGSPSRSSKPKEPDSYSQAVDAVKAGDYTKALSLLQKVVDRDSRNADAWNYIGFSHRKLEHYDKSLAAYQKALSIDPEHKGALEYLGELYVQTGEIEKAKAQLEKLDDVCGIFGCEEYDDLKAAIERGQAGRQSS